MSPTVYILTERAPESLALREIIISTPESLEAGESQYQREASSSEKGLEVIRNSVLVT